MRPVILLFQWLCTSTLAAAQTCPDYADYAAAPHAPFSGGVYNLSYQRPAPSCRTFTSPAVESTIARLNSTITDPDLSRLFENSFPNTLDTAIKWKGYAADNADEELTFVITGDMYTPPSESGLPPSINSAATNDVVTPSYANTTVYECKYELDSLAAFLEISTDYYTATNDLAFFSKYSWVAAVQAVLNTAQSMTISTYAANGSVNTLPYTFQRLTTSAEDTLANKGTGNPVQNGTDLIRSAFRPSDDACIYQFFIPANMMFAHQLNTTSALLTAMGTANSTDLATELTALSASLSAAITRHGIFPDPVHGAVYAYEVDGYGGRNIMDDANIPSLLSAPLIGYLAQNDSVYQATRALLLSADTDPYFMRGPVIDAVGGPHDGPGFAWPMASIVRIFTSGDDGELAGSLKELVGSTDGLGGWSACDVFPFIFFFFFCERLYKTDQPTFHPTGLIHESVNTFDQSHYTRPW
ncbi:hypothetical protein HO133_006702 [Letharia lupina]|uniref:Uncharacterized protein n=1 Tax=Letharia lupina TaxID=560253 RepID=A0A8H6C5V3_9LECA|nr:uncharacterized protein HO133_006702 [Letharia lupina]KAF6217600.1 hypothetical protein HO133_006702 [Letharia lupina]